MAIFTLRSLLFAAVLVKTSFATDPIWNSLGCYTDKNSNRDLLGQFNTDGQLIAPEVCQQICGDLGFTIAGVEWGIECWCGNTLLGGTPSTGCTYPCNGDSNQICGGQSRINLYELAVPFTQGASTWVYQDCYTDSIDDRTLALFMFQSYSMTQELCQTTCLQRGYTLAGVEFYTECHCANVINPDATTATNCNLACQGNTDETCGGADAIGIFAYLPPAADTHPDVGFTYQGCYTDNTTARTLTTQIQLHTITIETCVQSCMYAGHQYAGLEYYDQCFCGDSFSNGGVPDLEDLCNYPCHADTTETCGGSKHLSVYEATSIPTYTWETIGCVVDQGRSLSYHVYPSDPVTVENCQTTCQAQGFSLSGTEFGSECWCDTDWQLGGPVAATSGCNLPCAGNSAEICGGSNRLSASQLVVSTPPVKREPVSYKEERGELVTYKEKREAFSCKRGPKVLC
jgi:hypothetical protein